MSDDDVAELFCVCDEEWCYCTERVAAPIEYRPPEIACPACADGRHVLAPGAEREA